MINSFQNYLKMGKVKKQTPNSVEAQALFEKAKLLLLYAEDKKVNEKTAAFVLEDAYESMREAAQSLMSLKGFKPYSHEATVSFIQTYYHALFSEEEIATFDHFRQLRNNSVYNASPISVEDAGLCIRFAQKFIKKVEQFRKG